MPILETDVAGALAMKEAGLDAVYVFFEHPVGGHPVSAYDETGCNRLSASETRGNASAEETFTKHNQTHVDNLKLAGETAATIDARVAEAAFELKSATEAGDLFNLRLPHDTDELRRYAKLKEIIALKEPDITPVSSVWGFGRPRWDVRERKHGYLPLRVAVIGPAASGKSTAARALVSRYDLPLIYPGALLRAAAYDTPTPLGVEAKRYLDSTQTVPDDFMMKLVWQRIQKEDCRRKGFLLDGFPHNHYQATELQKHGIFLDKVLVLEMDTKSVIARTEGRLIDPVTGNTYHKDFAPPSDDEPEVQQRVVTRHDDEVRASPNHHIPPTVYCPVWSTVYPFQSLIHMVRETDTFLLIVSGNQRPRAAGEVRLFKRPRAVAVSARQFLPGRQQSPGSSAS